MPKSRQIILPKTRNLGLDVATKKFLARSKAANTFKAYQSDINDFADWCRRLRVSGLPVAAEAVANYLSYLAAAGAKALTIRRHLAAN